MMEAFQICIVKGEEWGTLLRFFFFNPCNEGTAGKRVFQNFTCRLSQKSLQPVAKLVLGKKLLVLC